MLSPLLVVGITAVAAQLEVLPRSVLESTSSITSRSLPTAEHTLTLVSKAHHPFKKSQYEWLRQDLPPGAQVGLYTGSYTGSLAGVGDDDSYTANITIGGQKFNLLVDTGSSDPWVAKKGFQCESPESAPISESECLFGPLYNEKESKTVKKLPKNFNITYGSGEHITGPLVLETVEIAGMTVKNQTFGLGANASWDGDTVNSGILGLAYPNLTNGFNTTNPDKDSFSPSNWSPYSPLFYTALSEGLLSKPLLSIALNRGSKANENDSTYDPNLGYISFGGIVPVPVEPVAVTVPVQKLTSTKRNITAYFYYTVEVKYDSPGSHNATSLAIFDTGTTLNIIPSHLAHALAKAFDPPAKWHKQFGLYTVDCNATAPATSIVIGGTSFPIDPVDQILPAGEDDLCITGTQPGGQLDSGSIFILGDTFLHNVVMTFDESKEEVTVTRRPKYNSGP